MAWRSIELFCALSQKHGFKFHYCACHCVCRCHFEHLLRSGTVRCSENLRRDSQIHRLCCFWFLFWRQLTFTPGWGKRSLLSLGANAPLLGLNSVSSTNGGTTNNGGIIGPSNSANGCKTSLDSLMIIYRLIQASSIHFIWVRLICARSAFWSESNYVFSFIFLFRHTIQQTEAQKYEECNLK